MTTTTTPGSRSRGPSATVDTSLSSVQMRQALNKLDEDGETGRNAMNSLKQCVGVMDPAAVPRFVSQVSETKEKGNSNSKGFAISLYEEVARVHGKLIVPHIPRIMTTLKRSLSASGSSPQLQQACLKVVLAIAKHAIDDGTPEHSNSVAEDLHGRDGHSANVLKHLCDPLLGALVGRLEPLAAGAAMCLHALVESEQWRHAPDDLVQNVFTKAAAALAERSARVAHLQLARVLSVSNPSFLSVNQGTTAELFLKAASQVLRSSTAVTSWQQRESAAQLATVILSTVDRHAVAEEELQSAIHALESCKLDRTSNVRASVKEGLRAARSLWEEDEDKRFLSIDDIGEKNHPFPPMEKSLKNSESLSPSPSLSPSQGSTGDDIRLSPSPSPTPSVIPLSPSAPSTTPPRARASASRRSLHRHRGVSSSSLRSPLRVATQRFHNRTSKSLAAFPSFESPRKENLPSPHDDEGTPGKGTEAAVMGGINIDMDLDSPSSNTRSSATESTRGWSNNNNYEKWMRNPDDGAAEAPASTEHLSDMETSPSVLSGRRNGSQLPSPVDGAIRDEGQQEVGVLSDDEDMCLFESNPTVQEEESRTHEDEEPVDVKPTRDRRKDSPSGRGAVPRSYHGVLDSSSMKHVFELKGPAVVGGVGRSPSRSIDMDKNSTAGLSPSRSMDGWKDSSNGLLSSPMTDASPAHLRSLQDVHHTPSPKVMQPLIDPKDFAAHSTPRNLIRSLQHKFSCPQPETPPGAAKARQEDELGAAELVTTDMDVETPTSTSTGWSVRTNPIASDESLRTDSEDSDHDRGRTVWKKMVLGSSTSPPLPAPRTPPAQETDNPDPQDIFRHRLTHPPSPASLDATSATPIPFLLPRVEPLVPKTLFKEDDSPSGDISTTTPDREEEKTALAKSAYLQDDEFLEASDSVGEALAELLRESAELDGSVASGEITPLSPRLESGSTGATPPQAPLTELSNGSALPVNETGVILLRNESAAAAAPKTLSKLKVDDTQKVGELASRGYMQKSKYSLLKWQLCLLVVGVPLAIVLAKVVFPSEPIHYLVPT